MLRTGTTTPEELPIGLLNQDDMDSNQRIASKRQDQEESLDGSYVINIRQILLTWK